MKIPSSKPRNLVHRAMLLSRKGGAHVKTHKQERGNARAAFRKALKKEGGFVQYVPAAH